MNQVYTQNQKDAALVSGTLARFANEDNNTRGVRAKTCVSCVITPMISEELVEKKAISARARTLRACLWSSAMQRPVQARGNRHTGEDPARERAFSAETHPFSTIFLQKKIIYKFK